MLIFIMEKKTYALIKQSDLYDRNVTKKKDCKLHFGVRTTKEKDNHEDRKC